MTDFGSLLLLVSFLLAACSACLVIALMKQRDQFLSPLQALEIEDSVFSFSRKLVLEQSLFCGFNRNACRIQRDKSKLFTNTKTVEAEELASVFSNYEAFLDKQLEEPQKLYFQVILLLFLKRFAPTQQEAIDEKIEQLTDAQKEQIQIERFCRGDKRPTGTEAYCFGDGSEVLYVLSYGLRSQSDNAYVSLLGDPWHSALACLVTD